MRKFLYNPELQRRNKALSANQNLVHSIAENPKLKDCFCEIKNCKEKGKISWADSSYSFLHIRFDGCVEKGPIRKCDCIIFRFRKSPEKTTMFTIEAKEADYNLSEIQEKLQFCVDKMSYALSHKKHKINTVPILCARTHKSASIRSIFSYRVRICGKKKLILLVKHGQNINSLS